MYVVLCLIVICGRWKNNVERKSKFLSLSKDAVSDDLSYDTLRYVRLVLTTHPQALSSNATTRFDSFRSMYCRQAVALAVNIRNHFDRIVHQQRDATIPQIGLPLEMPQHMKMNDCVPINVKKIGDEVVVNALSYKYQVLEVFVVTKFPMLKRFLKRRRIPRLPTTDVKSEGDLAPDQHGDEIDRSAATGIAESHIISKRVTKASSSRSSSSSSDSVDGSTRGRVLSDDIGLDGDEDEEELTRIDGGHYLRPRRCKRPRTYTFALSSTAFSDDSTQDTSRLLEDSEEEDGEGNHDDEEDESDFCDNRRPKHARGSKRYRTRHSVRRHIAALKVQEVLCRYEKEETDTNKVSSDAGASPATSTPSSQRGSPRKRYLRVPKSPVKKRLPQINASEGTTPFVKREEVKVEPNHRDYVQCGPPKMLSPVAKNLRDMLMEDFVLFDEQEMLADPMLLSTSTLGTVSTASLCKDAAQETCPIDPVPSFHTVTAKDMLRLHPLPWQLEKVLPSDDVIAFTRAKSPTHSCPSTGTPDPVSLQLTVVAHFNCETPISTRGTPSEALSLLSTSSSRNSATLEHGSRSLLPAVGSKDMSFLPISPLSPL